MDGDGDMDSEARARRLELLEQAFEERRYLLGIHDVLGYAVGFRVRDGEATDEPVLTVYVRPGRRELDRSDFPRNQRIPERLRLRVDDEVVWLPVDLVESEPGELLAGSPVRSGLSVGNSRRDDSGTIGWIARTDDDAAAPVFCSAFHVLLRFDGSNLRGGADKSYEFLFPDFEHVLSPSIQDDGNLADHNVGHVLAGRRSRLVDVAVVSPRDAELVEATAVGIGEIGSARFLTAADLDPADPPTVQLRGRSTTQVTQGTVRRYPAAHVFSYPDRPNGLMLMELIETDIATRGGDSGALLLDEDRRPLGMLVGRAGGSSFFMHMRNIIEATNLRDF